MQELYKLFDIVSTELVAVGLCEDVLLDALQYRPQRDAAEHTSCKSVEVALSEILDANMRCGEALLHSIFEEGSNQ